MGNRAIIKAKGNDNKAVYLHWNGGRDSVEAFLKYCSLKNFRGFETDYGMARFCQVVGNFFGGSTSIGICDSVESQGDNGVYIVKNWEIVGREDNEGIEQNYYDLTEMLKYIDERQPKDQQLGDFLDSKEIETKNLKIGDIVFIQNLQGEYEKFKVIGFGVDKYVNGTKVFNLPFVDRFANVKNDYSENINNYITTEKIRIASK